jgi:mRNA-degrading endonuclease RelE of RelBE toxin-antitoxin system
MDLRAIGRREALQILHAIDDYLTTRKGDAKRLQPPLTGSRLRVGDWRVFFKVLKDDEGIEVSRVLHRSVAYRS